MHGAIAPLSQYVFMAWCLIKHRVCLHVALKSKKLNYLHLNIYNLPYSKSYVHLNRKQLKTRSIFEAKLFTSFPSCFHLCIFTFDTLAFILLQ
jgi:hypothetical protein